MKRNLAIALGASEIVLPRGAVAGDAWHRTHKRILGTGMQRFEAPSTRQGEVPCAPLCMGAMRPPRLSNVVLFDTPAAPSSRHVWRGPA